MPAITAQPMANDMAEKSCIIKEEEYRSRWGGRASNPLEGAQAFSVGSTPASSATFLVNQGHRQFSA